jgi:DNA-binding transcriptional ArsR family regulator
MVLALVEPSPVLGVVSDGETVASMLHPLRLRMLQLLREPDSAAGLARRLDQPRQKLAYHLRQLEAAGLVELVEERRKGNCTERVVRTTSGGLVIDPAVLGSVGADPALAGEERPVTYLVSVLARGVRELARLRRLADRAGKRVPVLAIDTEVRFASAADQAAFSNDLAASVRDLVARHHDDTARRGRRFRVVVGAYPVPPDGEEDP